MVHAWFALIWLLETSVCGVDGKKRKCDITKGLGQRGFGSTSTALSLIKTAGEFGIGTVHDEYENEAPLSEGDSWHVAEFCKTRYVKFVPRAIAGGENWGCKDCVQIAEIMFLDVHGRRVDMSRATADDPGGESPMVWGATRAIDGQRDTQWFSYNL